MSLKNKKSKLLRVLDFVTLGFQIFFATHFPTWVDEGYLSTWYLKIAVGIAVYGGLVAGGIWLWKDIKKRGL